MTDTCYTVTEPAYGKINLYLEVLDRRSDGYHHIRSVMHTVSLSDTVTVTICGTDGERSMTCSDPTLTCGADNLCLRAAHVFFEAQASREGCRIHLEKRLPREAGLGGGSADAAAVLRALNRLQGEPFSAEELCRIGATIGADVPFCVTGGAALAEGIGERLSSFPALPGCHIVISGGIGAMSTPEAYRRIDRTPVGRSGDFATFSRAMSKGDLTAIGRVLYNRFEDAVPSSSTVKEILLANGAAGALMTGSGTAVFGLFISRSCAETAALALREAGLSAYLCEPIGS